MKKTLITIISLLVCFTLFSCSSTNDDSKKFVGTYEGGDIVTYSYYNPDARKTLDCKIEIRRTFTLNKGGTGTISVEPTEEISGQWGYIEQKEAYEKAFQDYKNQYKSLKWNVDEDGYLTVSFCDDNGNVVELRCFEKTGIVLNDVEHPDASTWYYQHTKIG